MNQIDLLHKFYSKLPEVKIWIEKTLDANEYRANQVIDLSFSKLNTVFSEELLVKSKVVLTKGKVPFPPLSNMGMPEFMEMERMQMAGITYKDVFFIRDEYTSESLCFHEMVHIVQWDRLGVNNFLLAYGLGLVQFGYADSPLEKMAYSLQRKFEEATLPNNITKVIQAETDYIWNDVAPFFGSIRGEFK